MALVEQQEEWFSAEQSAGGLSEFHIQKLSDTNNEVFRERLLPNFAPTSISSTKMWAQTFDLGDAVCVCVVSQNQLEMSLVHLTDEPLSELKKKIEQGDTHCVNLIPNRQNAFIRDTTETFELQKELERSFQKFQHAKLTFEAPIVPNISLKLIEKGEENLDSMCGRGPRSTQFRLTFASKSHQIYQVYFDRYWLAKNKTLYVEKSDDQLLKHLRGSHIKVCDCVQDAASGGDVFVLGSSSYVAPAFDNEGGNRRQEQVRSILDESLTFVTGDRTVINPSKSRQNGQNRQNNQAQNQADQTSLIGALAQGLRQKIGLESSTTDNEGANLTIADKFKVQQNTAILQPNMNVKNLEGVVALKTLTNGLLLVVYSNSMLRIFQISNFSLIEERNLLADSPVEGLKRVTEAFISFNADGTQFTENEGFCKKIDIAVGLVGETGLSSTKKSIIDYFCLEARNIKLPVEAFEDQTIGNLIEFKENLTFSHQNRICMSKELIVANISYEQSLKQFIYTTKNQISQETRILMANNSSMIEDFNNKAKRESFYDKIDISDKEKEQFSDILKGHYTRRILAPNRFSCGAIEELLQKENLNDLDNSLEENVLRNIQLTQVGNVSKFLLNLKEIELCNQDLLVVGEELSRFTGHRFLVRPLGISILAKTTKISKFASCIRNSSQQNEQVDSQLLQILQLLASDIDQKVQMMDQVLLQNPNKLKEFSQQILKKFLSDQNRYQLSELISDNPIFLQEQLQEFMKQVVWNVLEVHSFGARKRHQRDNFDQNIADQYEYQPSHFTLRLLEQKILNEITSLSSCLKYIYLAQVFIEGQAGSQFTNEQREDMMETWIKQIVCLQNTLSSNFTGDNIHKNVNSIQSISRNGSILFNHMLEVQNGDQFSEKFCCQDSSLEKMMYKVLKQMTFSQSMSNKKSTSCFIPQIAKNLINQDQIRVALNYLDGIGASNMGIEHAKMICLTHMTPVRDLHKSENRADLLYLSAQFKQAADQILALSQSMENTLIDVNLEDILLLKGNRPELRAVLDKINQQQRRSNDFEITDKASQLILASATELASEKIWRRGASSQAMINYFLKRALEMTPKTYQNYLFQCIFQSQQAFPLLQHWAVSRIEFVDTRQAYMLEFVIGIFRKDISAEERIQYLAKCTFAHDDITLLIEALQKKIKSKFEETLSSWDLSPHSQKFDLQSSWIADMQHLIEIYWQVAQIYEWKDQFCQFVFSCHQNFLIKLIDRISQSPSNDNASAIYLSLVKLDAHILGIASTAAFTCGASFQFTAQDQSSHSEVAPNSSKRSPNEKTTQFCGNQRMGAIDVVEDPISVKRQTRKSRWTAVDAKKILAAQLIAQARIECSLVTQSDSSEKLAKICAQLGKFDLAIDLAITNGQNPAYPITSQLVEIKNQQVDTEAQKIQIQKAIEQRINLIEDKFLVSVAQALIGLFIKLPDILVSKIIESNQIGQVIGCLLSEDIFDTVQAVKIVSQSEQATKNLLQTDSNTLVLLLQNADQTKQFYEKHSNDLEMQLQHCGSAKLGQNQGFASRRKVFVQGGDLSGLTALDDALGENRREILKSLVAERAEENENGAADSSDEEDQARIGLKNELQKCTEDIRTLTEGLQKIKQTITC